MRKKQLIIALLLMSVLAIVSWVNRDQDNKSTVKSGDKVFAAVDTETLNKIEITSPWLKKAGREGEVILHKKDGRWYIKNRYDIDADPALMRKFYQRIENLVVLHPQPFREVDLPLFKLNEEAATTIKLYHDGEAEPKTFLFGDHIVLGGKNHGRFVYMPAEKAVVSVGEAVGELSDARSSYWLRKYLPFHEQVGLVTFYAEGSKMWSCGRHSGDDGFAVVYPKDAKKSSEQLNNVLKIAIGYLRDYTDVLLPADLKPAKNFTRAVLEFTTFSGRKYKVKFEELLDRQTVRCLILFNGVKNRTQFALDFGSDGDIKEFFQDWHFSIPSAVYESFFQF